MLLIGPPGSGKTSYILEQLEAAVREQHTADVQLITPTASMAQHLLHELARRGLAIPTRLILPIREVICALTPDLEEPPGAIEQWLLRSAVEQAAGEAFGDLAHSPGLLDRVRRTIQDLQAARCSPEALSVAVRNEQQRIFQETYKLYERFLGLYGFVSPAHRLTVAAQNAALAGFGGAKTIFFDGFFHLTPGEADLMESLETSGAKVTVSLPQAPPRGLLHAWPRKFLEGSKRPVVEPEVVVAPSVEAEIEEAARRILASGRPFRETGLIVRSPETYASTIAAVFERFQIPFQMRRQRPLADHDAVRLVRDLLHALAAGFPGEATLFCLRRPACRIGLDPHMGRYDFAVRDRLPGDGIDFLRKDAPAAIAEYLDELAGLLSWREERLAPSQWAERCRAFRARHLRQPAPAEASSIFWILEIRCFGQAARQFDEATAEAARLLDLEGAATVAFRRYLDALDVALERTVLQTPDSRRDVVNVLDAYEARQWELPLVIVCGMVEGRFPVAFPEDPFFPDPDRKKLQKAGFAVRSRADLAADEEHLFRIAVTRATAETVLTYPELDEAGAPLLRSFFLSAQQADHRAVSAKPAEWVQVDAPAAAQSLSDPRLRSHLLERYQKISPSKLERFLQCPYLFFAQETLRLEARPHTVEARLDPLAKGSVLHAALARWSEDRNQPIAAVAADVFEAKLEELHLRPSFRTALVMAQLQEDLERFASEPASQPLLGAIDAGHEQAVDYVIEDEGVGAFKISGRIDRFETFEGGYALVIDYKHSAPKRIKEILAQHEALKRLQGPLYLLGLESAEGLRPGGMLFWGLRQQTSIEGWVLAGSPLEDVLPSSVEVRGEQDFREALTRSQRKAGEVVSAVRDGVIDIAPIDARFCQQFCDFRDVCRIKTETSATD